MKYRSLRLTLVILGVSGITLLLRASLPTVATGTWGAAGSMAAARSGACIVVLSDGRLLISGGADAYGPTATADLFSTTGSWSAAAKMSSTRSHQSCAVLQDGHVLVAGGTSSNGVITNSAELYDPSADSWTPAAFLNDARSGATTSVLQDGRVLIAGGQGSGSALNTLEIYDPNSGTFSNAGTMSSPRQDHAAAVLNDGRVLIVGGFDGTNPLASSDIFDPSSGTVSAGPNLGTARYEHSATTLLNGLVVAIGGAGAGTNGMVDLASAEIFDPSTGAFTTASATLTTAREGHQAYLLPKNNSVLIEGGTSSGTTLAASELFVPQVNSTSGAWTYAVTPTGSNVTPRNAATGSPIQQDGLLLAAGGTDASGNPLASTELYAFPTVKTDQADYPPGTTVNITGSGFTPGETVTITLVESPLIDTHGPYTITAQQDGTISDSSFTTDLHDVNVRFWLSAVGSQSGWQALNTFTDANKIGSVTVGSQVGTLNAGATGSATYVVTVDRATGGGTSGAFTANLSTGTLPTGVTASFNVSSLTFAPADTSKTSTLTLTTTAAATQQTTPFSVTATNSIASADSASANGTLTIGAPLCIAPGVTTQPTAQTITYGQNATFTAAASGNPSPIVQWQVSTNGGLTWANLSDGGVVSGSSTGTLTLTAPPVSLSTNQYRAVFTNTCGGTQTATSNAATLTVNKATVTAAVTANNKSYDATTLATQNGCTLTGVLPGDVGNVTCSGSALAFTDKNVGTGKTVNVSGISLSGTAAENYQLSATTTTTTANITARAITVTAAANTKNYDGTTSATATPTITSGTLASGDTANFTEAYASKSVGTGLTLNPSGAVNDGNGGNNYAVTFVGSSNGIITARPITVTAATNTKSYDGTTSAAAVPTITSGSLVTGDTANFTEAYTTKNAGSGLTLVPAGSVSDGNSGNNYAVTLLNNSTGVITARPITVTAGTNTKSYDGTTSAAAVPTLTGGSLVPGDTANFTEAYTTKNAGSGLTLVPAGSVSDGNSGNNYAVTLVNNATGVIMARAITVTASSDTKVYDGTTSSTGTPAITSGTLATGDTASFTQVFDSKNAGSRTLTASGAVNDGNGGNNYTITLKTGNGTITARPITVTAATNTKTYDGTTSAAAIPMITSGTLVSGDTASFTEVYSSKSAGSGLTLIPSGAVSDGNGGNNYAVTLVNNTTGVINAVTVTPSITASDKLYDGTTTATLISQTLSGVISGDTVTLTVGAANFSDANAGNGKTVTATGLTLSGASAGNYQLLSATATTTANITPATPAVIVTGGTFTYDAMPHAASAVATGVGGVVVPGFVVFTYTPPGDTTVPVSAGSYSVNAAFTSSNTNYTDSVGAGAIVINQAQLSVTAADASRPYGRSNPAFTGILTGLVAGDGITATYASAASATTAAGVYGPGDPNAIVPTLVDSNNKLSNYNVTSTNGTLTITAIPLLVIANDKTRAFGAADPAFDAQYFSFVNGDTATSSLTGSLNCTPSNSGDRAGSYAIHCDGLSSNNYTLTFVDGTLTVTDPLAIIAVTPGSPSATYGSSTTFAAQGAFASSASRTLANAGGAAYQLQDLSTGRSGAAEAEGQGKLYAIGGTVSGAVSDTVEVYDPVSNNWSAVHNLNNARTSARAASVAGKVYVFGGCGDAACTSLVAKAEVYDSSSNTWAAVSSSGFTPRSSMAVSVIGGKIYVAGGNDNAGNALSVVEIYDPGTDTWSSAASLKTNLGPASGGVVNGTFYVVGISGSKAEVEAFNGTSWSKVNSGVQPLTDVAAAVLNNVIYVVDGANIHGYDPASNTWTDKTSLNTARQQPEPVTIGNLIYVAGDAASSASDANAVESFASDEAQWSSSDTTVSAIDQTGKASALKVGSATITATSIISPSISGSTTLTVSPAKVTPAIAVSTKTYDGNTIAAVASCTISPVVGSDDVACSVGAANFSDKNAGTGKTVTGTGITLTGNNASNYMLSSTTATTAADISARPLTVVATGVNKVYDGTTSATVILSDNRVTGDVFTDSYTGATFSDKNVGNGKTVSVTGISINGTDAGNYTVNATATTAANITPRTLTVTATGMNKVYDGTATATVTLSTDKLAGDYVNVGYTSATFADKNVANGKTVTVSGVSITGGADAGNYTLSGVTQVATTANITPRPLTVTATGVNKQYDGTTAATVTLADNRVTGDVFTDSYTSATFSDKNVGTGKTVNVSGISISGTDAGNYTFNTTASTMANITCRPLTVTATGTNKQYDGTMAATVTLSDNRVTGDVFTDSYASATFTDKNVGSGKTVSVSGIAISGTDAANYTLNTTAMTTANITPRTLTVTATGVNKVYDGTTTATVTLSDNRVTGDLFTDSYASATFADKNVANGKTVTVTGVSIAGGADAGNYTLNGVTQIATTANITPAPASVTPNPASKVYGSADPGLTGTLSGFLAADNVTATYNRTAGEAVLGSPYTISATLSPIAALGNYSVTYNTANFTITPAALTITASGAMVNYGTAVPAITPAYTGFVNGDTAASLTTAPICTTSAHGSPNGSPVGSYATNCSGAVDSNYIISYMPGTVTIQAVPLVITASSPMVNYGAAVPAITASYTGLVNGDSSASLTTTPSCTTAAHGPPSGSPVGSYATNCSGAMDSNYVISYTPGAVTIQAVPLTITASSGSMIYGGPVFPALAGYTGLVNGDAAASLTTQPACWTTATSLSPVSGNPYASACSGAMDSNYIISYVAGMVTVTQATTTTAPVSSSVNPSTYMQLVTFTATVTPQYAGTTPTGTVTFYNNGVSIGTGTLNQGSPDQATLNISTLPDNVGGDQITATYVGDGNFVTSTSSPITQTVNPSPNVSLSPMFVSFGNLNVNATSKMPVTLTNIGDATLNISMNGFSITGTDSTEFAQTNNCGSTVAAGKSCTITVSYTPTYTGQASASLQITDNDDDSTGAQQTVSLTGAGLSTISGGSLFSDALFATSNGCGSILASGGSTVDSFDSTKGYISSHVLSGGNVGTNGNVTLNGGKSMIYGTAAVDSILIGNCSKGSVTGITNTGGAQVTGGAVALGGPITPPTPPVPSPAPPTTTQNISGSCGSISGCTNTGTKSVSLTPGQYGNLSISGGTTAHFSTGVYNINSLTLSGNSVLYVDPGGPVVVNLAGASLNGSNPAMDASGGSIQNQSGKPSNLQFTYAGSRGLTLSGGSWSYATVYAPNALVNMSGGTDFFGSIIGGTITASGGTATHFDTSLADIQPGSTIWLTAVVNNVGGLPASNQVKLYLTNSSIQFTGGTGTGVVYNVPAPNAVVTFNSAAQSSGAKTTYDLTNNRWSTAVAKGAVTGNTFVAGVAFKVPTDFPTGIQNATWSASFSTDTQNVNLQWQWSAAVYTSFGTCNSVTNTDCNALGVNAEDGSANMNGTDPAGTPEAYKASVIFGGTGGGFTNYTGYYTSAAAVVPTIAPMSVSPSSFDFGTQNQGTTTAAPMTAVLSNNDSVQHNFTGAGIQLSGTNAADFTLVPNGPGTPNNCLAMSTLASGASCTLYATFTPADVGTRTAKIALNDDANNSPQTVYLSGTGQ